MAKILVIGGGGYVGSALCPVLVSGGYDVTAYDLFIYGKHVLPHSVKKITGDMRDIPKLKEALVGMDAVIHLACISNDPSFDLDPELGRSINLDCFPVVCEAIKDAGVKRFIYASSSSVYGVHDSRDGIVTEATLCNPLTDYSKFKLECEHYLRQADMGKTVWTIVRPATVCGFAPRLRLDLIVNILTVSALANRKIQVHGGGQLRPNLYISDMVRAYCLILRSDTYQVKGQIFNVGGQNLPVSQIAKRVATVVADPLMVVEKVGTIDNRSYHISSKNIDRMLGFTPKYSITTAIKSLMKVYPYLKDPLNNPQFHNIKRMKELNLK